jgi:hypothetical protein
LQEKQAKKEFKDAGIRTGYSRKEKAAYISIVSSKDLVNIEKDEVTAINLIQKKKVFPPINYDIEVNAGVSSGTAFLKDYVQKSFPAKPNQNTITHREVYVKVAEYIMKKFAECYSLEDLKKNVLLSDIRQIVEVITNDTDRGIKDIFKEYFSVSLYNTIDMLSGYAYTKDKAKIHTQAKKYDGVTKEQAQEKYDIIKSSVERNLDRYNKTLMHLKDVIVASDMRKYQNEHSVFRGGMISSYMNKKDVEGFKQYVKSVIDKYIEQVKEKLKPERLPFDAKESDADWSWIVGSKGKGKARTKSENTFERTPLDHIKRTGGIEIIEISETEIINKLGFVGVTLGNYVKDNEAKEHIRYFISAIADLLEITNLNQYTMNERLSIGFGAYGRGGKAMATYYTLLQAINLTKRRGDGSVAHEYGHFLDNFLNNFNNSDPYRSQNAMTLLLDMPSYWKSAMRKKYRSIYENRIHEHIQNTINSIESLVLKKMITLFGFIRFGVHSIGSESNNFVNYSVGNNQSYYYKCSKSMPNNAYWSSEVEMFARGFEVYIFDKLKKLNRENNYLVDSSNFSHMIYPQNINNDDKIIKDREILYTLYDDLMSAIKQEKGIKDFDIWNTKRTDEYIVLDNTQADLKVKSGVIVEETESKANETDEDRRRRKLKLMLMLEL